MTQIVPSETLSLLTRLSQKPGVQSTLVLARDTGAIVHTSGFASSSAAANPNTTLPASAAENAANNTNGAANGTAAAASPPLTNGKQETGMRSAEDVARMVHSFVEAAGELVKNLEEEDEVKLLRLRTKKNELVIVPDPRFMIVVVHDTPPTP